MKKTKDQRAKEAIERLKSLENLLQDRILKTDSAMQQAKAIGKAIADLKK